MVLLEFFLCLLILKHNQCSEVSLSYWPYSAFTLIFNEISWISTLLVPNKEKIRKHYQDPQRFVQATSILHSENIYHLTYQPNLGSIVTECSEIPQDQLRMEDCVQGLLDFKISSEFYLMDYLVVRRAPFQVVRMLFDHQSLIVLSD
jgi:hypothetical protein